MWKHDDYLLWVWVNNMPVIQWMCGISLKLRRRGICHLATPFTLTVGIFLSCTESKSSLSRPAARDQKQVYFQHSQESVVSDNWLKPRFSVDWQESRQLFLPAYNSSFWRQGKKLNKTMLYPELTGTLVLSVVRGSGWESFHQRPGSLIIWK